MTSSDLSKQLHSYFYDLTKAAILNLDKATADDIYGLSICI